MTIWQEVNQEICRVKICGSLQIDVNDLPSCQLASEMILYADDTVIYYSSTNLFDLESKLNSALATISSWFSSNLSP